MNYERVTLRELTPANCDEVLALRVAPSQKRFVGSVAGPLEDAKTYPQANPWYRAVYAGDEPDGFIMLSGIACRGRRRSSVRGFSGSC